MYSGVSRFPGMHRSNLDCYCSSGGEGMCTLPTVLFSQPKIALFASFGKYNMKPSAEQIRGLQSSFRSGRLHQWRAESKSPLPTFYSFSPNQAYRHLESVALQIISLNPIQGISSGKVYYVVRLSEALAVCPCVVKKI